MFSPLFHEAAESSVAVIVIEVECSGRAEGIFLTAGDFRTFAADIISGIAVGRKFPINCCRAGFSAAIAQTRGKAGGAAFGGAFSAGVISGAAAGTISPTCGVSLGIAIG